MMVADDFTSQRPLKQRSRNRQRHNPKRKQKQQVHSDRHKAAVLKQDLLEAVHRIGKRIDDSDRLQPRWNPVTGEIAPLGKKSSVFNTPNIARGTSGSSTRTISRNMNPLKATEVQTISSSRSKADSG